MTTQVHLNVKQTINLGSFYTPDFIVKIVNKMLLDSTINTKEYVLLDSSCGYGNFLKLENFKRNIGADIDSIAIEKAREKFKDSNINPLFLHTNSLHNIQRKKFKLKQDDKLIIVSNPPYNDKTSIVQNHLKNKNFSIIDSMLQARDIGISFLRSFDILKADFVCVLHPLSYLIKEANFKTLKNFTKNYRLLNSLIISSQVFCPKSLGFFPIIIALYQRDERGMDFDFINNWSFKTLENKHFRLNDFDFIAKYINKYPNKNCIDSSQKVAMFYTLRDINALRRSKTFLTKENANTIFVTKDKYSLYCYVDVFKLFISHIPYYFGNCDILINYYKFKTLESSFIKVSESKIISPEISDYFKELLGWHYEN